MIRIAETSDLKNILLITKACALKMEEEGIFQWNQTYPDRKTFINDLEKNQLYVFEKQSRVLGCIVISSKMDLEYKDITWLSPNLNKYYIHRLAVDPDYQGQGIAKSLMTFAENMAQENQIDSIRLDTFSANHKNQVFYESRGYKRLENIYYLEQSPLPFYCYELILKKV